MRKYYRFNSNYNLESFVIDPASQTNIAKVGELLQAEFIGTDALIIRSKLGCGATHLLSGITHELESREIKLLNLNHKWLARHFLTERAAEYERQETLDELNIGSYLVIDHVTTYNLIRTISVKPGKWLGDAILSFLSSGGKLICAHSYNDTNHADLQVFLSSINVAEVYLDYPTFEAIQKMALTWFPTDFVSKYGSKEVYEKCINIREYENVLTSLEARERLRGSDEANSYFEKFLSEG
jgi:hypothetical protein